MAQKFLTDIEVTRGLVDSSGDLGVAGQVLSSTGTGTNWITNEANSTVVYLDEFTGDNSTVDFTLSVSVTDENVTQVYIDGVYQNKDTYSIAQDTLSFSTAPPLSADIEVITFATITTSDDLQAGVIIIPVKNTHTASIDKGEPVYITGNVGSSARLQIAPADASNSAKMPAAGLLLQTLAVNAEGYVVTGGYLRNITTDTIDGTSTSSNDTVYVKAGGGLTMTKPTGTNLIQNIAKIARSSSGSSGSLLVSSILRTNDVPNITNDYFWLGNSSGVATPTEFTSTGRGLLSVGTEGTAAGDGNLAYNNSSGVFTYTPPVLGGLSGTTDDITEGSTNLYYTDARARAAISENSTQLSYNSTTGVLTYTQGDTDTVSEGATNLYYTDTRVGTYLTNNSYATQSYVNTQVSNLVDSAPSTLDTLNELAAALGDDANFSTTVTNSIATKMPLAGGIFTGNVQFNDNIQLNFGSGADFKIKHNGTNSFLENYTGGLYIDQHLNDGDIIFRNDDGSGGLDTYIRVDGSTEETLFLKRIRLNDNITADFGTARDLQIYHDGSNSFIENSAGYLMLKSDTAIYLRSTTGNEPYISCNKDGSVDLYYNDSKKFETTSTGVSVTGGATFTGAITIEQDGDALNLRSTTNAVKPRITFSSHTPTTTQIGHIEYTHVNTDSYGSNEAFIIGGTESTITVLADGKLMYNEGIYSKPGSGTGAGTRKDSNWDTAYTYSQVGHLPLAGGTLTGALNATRFILPSTGTTTPATQYLFTNNTNTATGKLIIQSGGGSAGYGGAINLFSHSHASKPGWVTAGISSGSGGKFSVNTAGTAGGTDVFTVDASGSVTAGSLTISGSSNGLYFTGGNNRMYFNGHRALEGATDGSTLQIGEGYNTIRIEDTTLIKYLTSANSSTFLTLHNDVGADLNTQKTFIDFIFEDDNDNDWPQVRIGAEVGQNSDANSTLKEGSGAFVVYTNNATTNSPGTPSALNEKFRVDYRGYTGIGTSSPGTKLDVYDSSASINIIRARNATQEIALGVNNGAGGAFLFTNTNHDLRFGANGSEVGRFKTTGQFRIANSDSTTSAAIRLGGENAPGGRLYLEYSGDTSYIDCYGGHGGSQRYRNLSIISQNLYLKTQGSTALTIDTSQRVALNNQLIVGTFNNSQTNTGEAWIGRAADRSAGTLTVQLGTGTGRKFEVVDYGWTTVEFSATDGGIATAHASFRAPIFYDSNDTGRYINPAGTSQTSSINMNNGSLTNVNTITINDPGYSEGISWNGGNGWQIYESSNANANSAGNLQFATGATHRFRVDTGGSTYSERHYDIANTGYYVDPASGTVLNGHQLNYNCRFRASTSSSFNYSTGYGFHAFENGNSNEPICVFYNQVATTAVQSYGINVISAAAHNNTTSRFFAGQGGSTERIKIYSNGNIQNSNNSYGQLSDINLKENIVDATPKLDEINQVRIVNFNYIGDVDEETNIPNKQIGVVAQELEEIFPGMVYECGDTETPTKSVKYSVFVPMLIKAVQELTQEVQTLKDQINGIN